MTNHYSAHRRISFIFIFSLFSTMTGQLALASEPAVPLQKEVARLLAENQKKTKAVVGVSIVDLRTGKAIVAERADELFVPASNQKILTSAFALSRLGGQAQFVTTVYSSSKDLVVVGQYDPTLGDPRLAEESGRSIYDELDRWATAIKSRCGGRVAGDIVVCTTGSYRQADWPKDQYNQWYAAPVAPINFNNNCFDVTFTVADGSTGSPPRAESRGGKAIPSVLPASRLIAVVNEAKLGRKQAWSALSNDDDSVVTISGTVAKASAEPLNVAMNNPPLTFGRVLADRLMRGGVDFSGKVRLADQKSFDPTEATVIAQTKTTLAAAMARANKRSLNMAAECIFLRAGDGTWNGSAALETATLRDVFGLDEGSFIVRDGGGLSRENRVSPAAITKLLASILKRPDAKVFLDSLPISGIDGTLQRRMDKPPYKGRVLGKTGYIAGVSTLSGYILDGSGKPAIAFSILANKVPSSWQTKELADQICQMLVDSLKQ